MQVFPGTLPQDFTRAVNMLRRPYCPIPAELFAALQAVLTQHRSDFLLLPGGHIVTIGNADGGYAIMPLSEWAAQQVRATAAQKGQQIGPPVRLTMQVLS